MTPMNPPVSVQPLFERIRRQIVVSTTLCRIRLPNVCITLFPERIVGVVMIAILPDRFWIGESLRNPETERRGSDVLSDIDPTFPLTCENISILRMERKESIAPVAP